MSEVLSFSLVAFSAIFFVVDPMAVVPIFVIMTEGDSEQKRRRMARKACVVTAVVLVFFALGGSVIFKLFSVTLASFKIAGGVLLMITALDMLQSRASHTKTSQSEIEEGTHKQDIAIVPLAMPLLAGPGSIATVMVLTAESQKWWQMIPILAAILLTSVIAYALLRAATLVNRVLGTTGRAVFTRVMGLMLAAIAVEFVIAGIRDALPEVFKH
ncbi:MAG: MarC family protein [Deltaproteobacteria bacterium]|nr:MarC family protein [Deltaproteobacteria bacterium]